MSSKNSNYGYGGYVEAGQTTIINSVTQSTMELQVNTVGHPGTYVRAQQIEAGKEFEFTGSNYGAAALILSGSHTNGGVVFLTGGGSLSFDYLEPKKIYEFSIRKIVADSVGTTTVLYKLRNS